MAFRRTWDRWNPKDIPAKAARVFGVRAEDVRKQRRNAAYRAAVCWYVQTAGGLTQREVAKWVNLKSGVAAAYPINRRRIMSREKRHLATAEKLRS